SLLFLRFFPTRRSSDLQSFVSILAGLVLGARLGAFTLTGYTLLGLAGLPIFAQFKGGIWMVLAPTFGFLLSFIIGAYVAGKIRKSAEHTSELQSRFDLV